MQSKIAKIKKEDIELYLMLWGYDGIIFSGNSPYVKALGKIYGNSIEKAQVQIPLIVTEQDENQAWDSAEGTYGVEQLLFELEVCSEIPLEIKNLISLSEWKAFISRFICIYKNAGWRVCCSKKMPLVKDVCQNLNIDEVMSGYGQDMILNNGNGGRIKYYTQYYSESRRVESLRIIVLFRAYIMELLCNHFKKCLHQRDVTLSVVNWNWALNHPLYPKEIITSADMEKRKNFSVSQIANNESEFWDFLNDIYGQGVNLEYVREVMEIPNRLKKGVGLVEHEDRKGKYLNVFLGERQTKYQPVDYEHTIYLLGGCVFFGYAVEDSETVASFLQKKLNNQLPEQKWKVVNYGTWGGDIDWTYKRLYKIPFKPGDIVLISYAGFMPLGEDWQEKDVSEALQYVKTEHEFYFNGIVHCNKLGYEKVADRIFKLFFSSFSNKMPLGEAFYLTDSSTSEKIFAKQAAEYIKSIQEQLPDLTDKNVGAIVMNCNPFTLGHQYLIEYSSKLVDILIIFVVEENRSYFSFEDRLELVRKGTIHLNNVYVVPSGQMIISTITFPGYFLKDTPDAVNLDSSMDVSIFGEYIGGALNIKTRFVGEEPFDVVTRNYNESMSKLLPLYGIQLVIIPRKESGGNVISASRVRALLKEKNFQEIKKLVPVTTYDYLIDKYDVAK